MSIATQISRLNNNINNMKTTKQEIKDAVNNDFDIINNEQIEDYAELIEEGLELYKDCIPSIETNQATEITVTDAMKYSRNKLELFGNTEQASTSIASGDEYDSPSPDHPQPIHVVTGNNTIEVQGKNLSNVSFPTNNMLVTENSLLPGTYTMSWQSESTTGFHLRKNTQSGDIIVSNVSTSPVTFVLNETCKVFLNGWSNIKQMANIQIEQGSTPTSYEPYYHKEYPVNLGSLELCKIGDYQDYLYKENGNWYKYGAVGKVVLDGSESWQINNAASQGNTNYFSSTVIDGLYKKNTDIGYSNYFIIVKNLWNNDTQAMQLNNESTNNIRLRINKTIVADRMELLNWLATHNVILYYVLVTPTKTQITDETLIAQLDAIYEHLQLAKGTNHITVTAQDLKPYMKLSYKNYESNLTNE